MMDKPTVRKTSRRARLFNAATVLSLLLCVAVALLWLRSYWLSDDWARDGYGGESGKAYHTALLIRSGGGGLAFARKVYTNSDPRAINQWAMFPNGSGWAWRSDASIAYPRGGPLLPMLPWWRHSGFGLSIERQRTSGYYGERGYAMVIPDWSLLAATALLPLIWLTRLGLAARRKAREGRCRRCGYDLRATPHRCPECGTEPRKHSRRNADQASHRCSAIA